MLLLYITQLFFNFLVKFVQAGDVADIGWRHAKGFSNVLTLLALFGQDTKDFSRFFKTRYEEICRELETPAYLRPYVLGKYIYKGASVEATARRALAHVEDVPWLHDGSLKPEDGAVAIRGCGQGELAWIYALMHPQTEVYATDPDPDNIAIASHCSHIPANLHFSVEETTENQ